jgi:hypothetical protein
MTEITTAPGPTPAGWYPDPELPKTERYWTGTEWPAQMSADDLRAATQFAVADAVRRGWRVETQTEGQVVIVSGNRPNHILHLILTILTLGLWLIPWIIITIAGGEKRQTLTITPDGRSQLT